MKLGYAVNICSFCRTLDDHWAFYISGSSLYYAQQFVNLQLEGTLKSYLLHQ